MVGCFELHSRSLTSSVQGGQDFEVYFSTAINSFTDSPLRRQDRGNVLYILPLRGLTIILKKKISCPNDFALAKNIHLKLNLRETTLRYFP